MDEPPQPFPALAEDATCDVAVIGSGIAGLSTAYELAKAGHTVIVVDRGPIGRGMTARTSAHLSSALDDYYQELISIRGEEIARLHFQSQAAAIDRIGVIAADERISCDYKRMEARLFLAGDEKEEALEREQQALTKVGLPGVNKRASVGGHKLSNGPCLIIPGQAATVSRRALRCSPPTRRSGNAVRSRRKSPRSAPTSSRPRCRVGGSRTFCTGTRKTRTITCGSTHGASTIS
jgi:hypothetical protein